MSLLSDDSVKSASGIEPAEPIDEIELEILKKREEIQKKSEEIANKIEERAKKKKRKSLKKLEEECGQAGMASDNSLPRAASTRRHSKRLSQHHGSPSKPAPLATHLKSISTGPSPHRSRSQHADHNTRPYPYVRPIDREMPYQCVPSSSNLPDVWTPIHDRFIAYLATHAILTKDGKIPAREETQPRWATTDICKMLLSRFLALKKFPPRVDAIEQRLLYLDRCENDYFNVPYGGYRFEEWGKGI